MGGETILMRNKIKRGVIMLKEIRFEMFKKLVPYLRGALWWAQDDLIKDRNPQFNERKDRVGHPLLSISKKELTNRFGAVPMLVGTSGDKMGMVSKSRCVAVVGLTKQDSTHRTYFGSIVEPGLYEVQDLMDGVKPVSTKFCLKDRKENEKEYECYREAWHHSRTMVPNVDKPRVSVGEMSALDKWCTLHGLN